METLDNNISESNKIPGSGCDTFTRPEEIQALSKYLGYVRKIQNENTQLENELLGIPGKTTGKFPEINKLPKESAQLDLSRENQIKSLSDKLISLDKNSSSNFSVFKRIISCICLTSLYNNIIQKNCH